MRSATKGARYLVVAALVALLLALARQWVADGLGAEWSGVVFATALLNLAFLWDGWWRSIRP